MTLAQLRATNIPTLSIRSAYLCSSSKHPRCSVTTDNDNLNLPERDESKRPGKYRPRYCSGINDANALGHEALDHGLFDVFPADDMDGEGKAEYNEGVHAYGMGDIEQATACFTKALQRAPGAIAARNNLAICLIQSGDREAGLNQLELALRDDPEDSHLLRNIGVTQSLLGKKREALTTLKRAAEFAPDDSELLFLQSTIHEDLGELDAAIECMRHACEMTPEESSVWDNLGIILHRADRLDEAIEAFEKAREVDPDHPLPHYNLGRAYAAADRLQEAEASFRRHLESEPEHSCALFDLGRVLADQHRNEESLDVFRTFLELEPEDPQAHASLGAQLLRLSRLDEAEAALRRALELDPWSDWPVHLLGCVEIERSKHARGRRFFREALARDPQLGESRRKLIESFVSCGEIDAALAELRGGGPANASNPARNDDASDENTPDDERNADRAAADWYELVNLLREKSEHARALDVGAEMARRFPTLTWVRGTYALALDDAGRSDDALRELKEVLKLDREDRLAQFHMGRILASQAHYAQAVPALEFVIDHDPDFIEARRFLAYCLSMLDRDDEARVQLDEILRIDPKDEYVKAVLADIESDDGDSSEPGASTPPDVGPAPQQTPPPPPPSSMPPKSS
jgi:tetratricopeptide (TPR) repeat protein